MKVDAITLGTDLATTGATSRQAEERGCDGWFTGETSHDPFLMAAMAAQHTDRIQVGTAIAVAFPRSPMHVAYSANDVQMLAEGRFVLGLGSQIQAHIEKRFSATWSHPAARMREFVQALRAIWSAWEQGSKLDFRGDLYQHTLMTPMFAPGPNPFGPPPVLVAAVGEHMTEVAGEVADGVFCHGFTTQRYLREHTLPAVQRGLDRSGRGRESFEVALPAFVVTGTDERELARVEQAVRAQIAFYGSTPAYRQVLATHGWEDLQEELNVLSKEGRWDDMADAIDDEVLEAFAVRAEPADVGHELRKRYDGLVDRLSLYTTYEFDDDTWDAFIGGVRSP